MGFDAKWTPDSAPYIGTPRGFGLEQNEPELAKKLKHFALASWTLLGLSGYARFDFRVDPTSEPFVIDVNPNPFLAPDASFAAAAAEAGLSYQDLIGRIVELAWSFARQGGRVRSVERASDNHACGSRLGALVAPEVC